MSSFSMVVACFATVCTFPTNSQLQFSGEDERKCIEAAKHLEVLNVPPVSNDMWKCTYYLVPPGTEIRPVPDIDPEERK